ncbi:MAG: hypothetical protein AAFX56_11845 [Pseudomonadota bacterium]
MSRAPFMYPLRRGIDGDAGGAADLQTDIMRFMAILALCLMAIFALVQSIPPVPSTAASPPSGDSPAVEQATPPAPQPAPVEAIEPEPAVAMPAPRPVAPAPERKQPVRLTRAQPTTRPAAVADSAPVEINERSKPVAPSPPESKGFTLRFESDVALSRLVATGQIGLFALHEGAARRMSVSRSRPSFWAAPAPGRFHEMDAGTVPDSVRDALGRSGWASADVAWAVTLPPRMSSELSRLMQEHRDGALVIAKDGSLSRATL